ncbi:MAG: carboxylesterase/lipase family protein [Cytophagales bacterium]|nr:carboxylesterase/lipase family protein [Rhizobacter sp.]
MQAFKSSDLFPIVETAQGRLRGLTSGGVASFKGIRYGADTSGANRFMPPAPPRHWPGVQDATGHGNHAPQMPSNRTREYADLIMFDQQPGGMGEDCLVLNLWSPKLDANARLPVMVHLHGGGYYAGSGNSPQTDGEMLARFGNAVVVTINHRLGSFGFLDLSRIGGERYAQSGMVGMLDIVAALGWVRENFVAFGGDPSRVLVFGQSGGGAKTSVLMAMPSAKGLFHRAGVMSGSALRATTPDHAGTAAENFLKILGIGNATLDKLHTLPFHELLAAQITMEMADRAAGEAPRSFSPVMNGSSLPRQPFDPDAPDSSNEVPMIISTVLDERSYRAVNFDLDEAALATSLGPNAEKLLAMYRTEDPAATPYLIQARVGTDKTFRKAAHTQAERKAAQGGAPVWAYLWKAPSPAYGGRFGATHGVDVGPTKHDIRYGLNGPNAESVRLADQLASAWAAFAATGNPNNPLTPDWPAYTLERRTTMVFDKDGAVTGAQDDPRRTFREFWAPR